jgi:hypothetical protein
VKRHIIYQSWFPTPSHLKNVLGKLTAPELRLYVALCLSSRGLARFVNITNEELKTVANLNDDSLPAAGKGLETRGLISAIPLDKRRESYRYDIHDKPLRLSNDRPPRDANAVSGLVRVPTEVVFRGEPSLDSANRMQPEDQR